MTHSIRIVTADDHPIFRDGLRRLLEAEPGFQVVGEAGTGREAAELVARLAPDVLLLDLSMPDGAGLDVLRAMDRESDVRVILLTVAAEKWQILEALQLGARGLITKDAATATLPRCIRAVMAGEYWLGRDRLPDIIDALRQLRRVPPPPPPAQTLTAAERRVVAAVVSGATNRDIAEELRLSEQTVKNYLSHIFDKLGVSNRLELALYAMHHKLVQDATPMNKS